MDLEWILLDAISAAENPFGRIFSAAATVITTTGWGDWNALLL